MTRSPTFSPAVETTTPPQTSGPAAPRPSPPGPTSPAMSWLHNYAHCRASLSLSRFPSISRCQVDGASATHVERTIVLFCAASPILAPCFRDQQRRTPQSGADPRGMSRRRALPADARGTRKPQSSRTASSAPGRWRPGLPNLHRPQSLCDWPAGGKGFELAKCLNSSR
jgi:hypothetical protein